MFPAILPSNWLFLTPSRVFINVCEVSGLNIQYMRITSVEIIPHHTNTFQKNVYPDNKKAMLPQRLLLS